jgi:hypothetical protein
MTEPENTTAISDDETVEAIARGGYPLEVTLLHALRRGGMHPQMGTWMQTAAGSTEYREVDLTAQLNAHSRTTGDSVHAGIYFFIEAKHLGLPSRLVGVADEVMSLTDLARNSCRFTGVFTQTGLPKSLPRLARCLEPLFDGPQCVHWTIVRKESKKAKAERDGRYAESMRTVVKATYWHASDWTEFLKQRRAVADLRLFLPVLIVDTQDLQVFNPTTQRVANVDCFQLVQQWEVGGRIHWACMPVIRASAIEQFVARATRVQNALDGELQQNHATLWGEVQEDARELRA